MATDIESRLGKIEDKLDAVSSTIDRMANQAEQIAGLWKKVDKLQEESVAIQKFQASCPRNNFQASISRLWMIVWPIALILLGVAFELLKRGHTP